MVSALPSLQALVVVQNSLLLRPRKSNRIDGACAQFDIVITRLGVVNVLLITRCDLMQTN